MSKLFIVVILTFVLGTAGWLSSIYKLSECDFEAPYKAEVVYGIGIAVPPLGAVIGYMDFGK